jgi:hypothetical protein
MSRDEYEAAVAAFIRSNGVTRCPTACALPTQGTIATADRAALQEYATARSTPSQSKAEARQRYLWGVAIPAARGD